MAYLMGIDIGSTSIKAVVYDAQGQMISQGSKPSELSYLDDEHKAWSVWEPQKMWQAVCEASSEAMEKIADKTSVVGVAVTGFGMDGLPMGADGQSLYPLISWHCPRTNEIAKAFSGKVGQDYIFDISGGQYMAIHSVYRMMWMQQNHPEIIEKTEKWLLIEDFINYKLSGVMATDFSMGWNTSLLDQQTGDWSDDLLEKAGLPKRILPELKQSGTVLGEITPQSSELTGLQKGTKIVLGGHDYICAALTVGAVDDDVVMDVTGTWEMILQASPICSHDKRIFESGFYVENHVAKDKYCFVASTVSGDMTEWFKDNLSFEELQTEQQEKINVWKSLMDKARESTAGANGCSFLPHFSGAGTPTLDPSSLGAYIGMSNTVSKADMIRATIEGLDYQFRQMVEALEGALNISPKKILAVGGATKNEFWMQNKADVCNKVIEVPKVYEATPLGAAMLAGIGTGVYADEREAIESVRKPGIQYEPDVKLTEKYSEYYNDVFKDIYLSLKNVNHKIFKKFK